ncbi:unnamed protein product [Malus baccata var. baccata]
MAALGKTNEFELKSSVLHHIPKFHGMSMEDPNKHLKEFEVVCSSMTPMNVDGSIMKMKAFPFSLLEKAKDWLYELAPGTVTSWESMKQAFLEKFFPTSRVILLCKRISGIQQNQGESFPTYYERFKTLVPSCPQHQMKEELLLQYFYEMLLLIERQMLDASAGGALVDKTPMAAKTLIANRALNAQQYEGVGQRDTSRQQLNEVRETIQISSGGSPNNPNNKEALGSNLRASIPSNTHQHKPHNNLPKIPQGQENQAKAMQNQDKRVDQMDKQIGQIAEFVGQFREQDFYVLEMDESNHSPTLPILLGRPFMKTARTKIDVFNGTLTMEFDGEVINFNLSDSVKYPSESHSCFAIDVIDPLAQDHLDKLTNDALELVIARGMDIKNIEAVTMHPHGMNDFSLAVPPNEDVIEMVAALESLPLQSGKFLDPISISVSANKLLPSVVQPPILELKPLPSHLKYVFLGDDETLPVIILSTLTAQEEDKLVRVLKEYKTAIGWTLADIKGISPTTCMHRILLDEGSKTSREAQRRLNPLMMEVVKKEIIKL